MYTIQYHRLDSSTENAIYTALFPCLQRECFSLLLFASGNVRFAASLATGHRRLSVTHGDEDIFRVGMLTVTIKKIEPWLYSGRHCRAPYSILYPGFKFRLHLPGAKNGRGACRCDADFTNASAGTFLSSSTSLRRL